MWVCANGAVDARLASQLGADSRVLTPSEAEHCAVSNFKEAVGAFQILLSFVRGSHGAVGLKYRVDWSS